jgi:hypothetical protein
VHRPDRELWVPAAVITEEGCTDEDRIIRQEARYRLKKGAGIRVFSRPEQLETWLLSEGLSIDARRSLITDAGQLVPGWSVETQGIESCSGRHCWAVSPELLAHFLVSTYISVLTWWLNSKNPLSPKDVDVAYRHLILPCLASIFG